MISLLHLLYETEQKVTKQTLKKKYDVELK